MAIANQYDEPGSQQKYFVRANNTEAVILAHPKRCRVYIANDTDHLVAFDKDNAEMVFWPVVDATDGNIVMFDGTELKNAQILDLGASGVHIPGGNVGIGSSTGISGISLAVWSPGAEDAVSLYVEGKAVSGSYFLLANTYDEIGMTAYYPGGLAPYDLRFKTNSLDRVTVLADGKVGIGLTNPGYLLDVYGDCNIKAGSKYKIGGTNLTYSDVGAFPATHGVSSNYIARATSTTALGNSLIYDDGTTVGIGVTASAANAKMEIAGDTWILALRNNVAGHGSALVFCNNDYTGIRGFIGSDITAGALSIQCNNNGSFGPLLLNSLGGNVGIGATAAYKLDVDGSINVSAGNKYKINGTNLSYTDVGAFPATHGVSANYIARATSTTALGNSLIYDNGTNVGIGTTVAAQKLHIYGSTVNIEIEPSTASTGAYYAAKNGGGFVYMGQERSVGGSIFVGTSGYSAVFGHGGNYNLHLVTNNSVQFTISNAGRVGIGSASPSVDLDFKKTSLFLGNGPGVSNSGVQLRLSGWNTGHRNWEIGTGFYGTGEGLQFTPSTANGGTTFSTPAMVIVDSSRVGIGKTDPGYLLDVYGDCNIKSGSKYKINGTDLSYTDVGAFPATHGVSANYIARATSTTALGNSLIYDSGTNVGIGTTNPEYKLQVAGRGYFETATAGEYALQGSWNLPNGAGGAGVFGYATNPSTNNEACGLYGYCGGTSGAGSAYGVYGAGDTADFYSPNNTYASGSSSRWKSNIKTLKGSLDKILKLRGVSYDFDGTAYSAIFPNQRPVIDQTNVIGVIAEEIRDVLPSLVTPDPIDEKYCISVNTMRLIPVLIEAIKELNEKIEKVVIKK